MGLRSYLIGITQGRGPKAGKQGGNPGVSYVGYPIKERMGLLHLLGIFVSIMSDIPEINFSEEHRRWLVHMILKCLAEAKDQQMTYDDLYITLLTKGFIPPNEENLETLLSVVMMGDSRVFWEIVDGKEIFHLRKGKYYPEAEDDPPTPELYRIPPDDNPEKE